MGLTDYWGKMAISARRLREAYCHHADTDFYESLAADQGLRFWFVSQAGGSPGLNYVARSGAEAMALAREETYYVRSTAQLQLYSRFQREYNTSVFLPDPDLRDRLDRMEERRLNPLFRIRRAPEGLLVTGPQNGGPFHSEAAARDWIYRMDGGTDCAAPIEEA